MQKRPRSQDTKRNRPIGFTDAEWTTISAAAANQNVSKSRYVADRALNDQNLRPHTPDDLQLIMAHQAMLTTLENLCAALPENETNIDCLQVLSVVSKIDRHLHLIVSLNTGASARSGGATS
ncbi:MAG: hypothetical protein AAGL89_16375 [Pseudomonadota bacterium]